MKISVSINKLSSKHKQLYKIISNGKKSWGFGAEKRDWITNTMKPSEPEPVKLFVGILYTDESFLEKAITLVVKKFAETDFKSPVFEFTSSDY